MWLDVETHAFAFATFYSFQKYVESLILLVWAVYTSHNLLITILAAK